MPPVQAPRDIAFATASDMTGAVSDRTVNERETEGSDGIGDTRLINTNWRKNYGYFRNKSDVKIAILKRAEWTMGKGWEAAARTTVILERLKGNGEDTASTILKNMVIVKRIGGDSYSEIILDSKGTLLNLKPLDPGAMVVILDARGMVKEYEYTS